MRSAASRAVSRGNIRNAFASQRTGSALGIRSQRLLQGQLSEVIMDNNLDTTAQSRFGISNNIRTGNEILPDI